VLMCAIEYYTYEDYKQWEGDWELINGLPLAMSPSPMRKHQSLASEIIRQIGNQLEDNCQECEVLGEIDYKVSNDTILRPNIVLTCNETSQDHLLKAPEIVVEIISSSTAKRDEVYKFSIYEAEKVKYYVLVYPDDLVAKIYKLDHNKYEKEGDFTQERYRFDATSCKIELDFEKIFKRFKK